MPAPANKTLALEKLSKLHIGSSRDAEVASHITRLLNKDADGNVTHVARTFTRTGETRGFMMVADPGSGKSHLIDRSLAKQAALSVGEFGRPRYLKCPVPSPATFKSMTLALLKEAGYPDGNPRKEAWSLWQEFRHRLSLLGITVVWIDEAQDLFCADRNLILRALKSLMQGENAVVVILSGTAQLAQVIGTDPQVKRRFTAMVLPDLVEQVDGANFAEIIVQYCLRLGLRAPVEADLVGRLFHAARYRFGRAVEMLLAALEIALERNADDLTMDHFAAAYAMSEACTAAENVFYAERFWLLEPDVQAHEADGRPRRNRRG